MRWISPWSIWSQVPVANKTARVARQVINQTVSFVGSMSPSSADYNFTVPCVDYTKCSLSVSSGNSDNLCGVAPKSNTQFTLFSGSANTFDVYVTGVEYY